MKQSGFIPKNLKHNKIFDFFQAPPNPNSKFKPGSVFLIRCEKDEQSIYASRCKGGV